MTSSSPISSALCVLDIYSGAALRPSINGCTSLPRSAALLPDPSRPGVTAGVIAAQMEKAIIHAYSFVPTVSTSSQHASISGSPVRSILTEKILTMAVSPDGLLCLGGSEKGQLFVWKVATGECLALHSLHYRSIITVRISHDGALLATGAADGTVGLWLLSDLVRSSSMLPEPIAFWSDHSHSVTELIFSHGLASRLNGRLLSASLDGHCHIYDLQRRTRILSVKFPSAVSACAMSFLEDRIYAGATDGCIYVCDLTGCHSDQLYGNITSGDAKSSHSLAASKLTGPSINDSIAISNTTRLTSGDSHSGRVNGLCFSLDELMLVSVGEDGKCLVWDVQSSRLLRCLFRAPNGGALSNAFICLWNSDSQTLMGANDLPMAAQGIRMEVLRRNVDQCTNQQLPSVATLLTTSHRSIDCDSDWHACHSA